ncbi:MAG: hypothetical protein ACK4Q5_00945 [Saprospiraceae bacterium]
MPSERQAHKFLAQKCPAGRAFFVSRKNQSPENQLVRKLQFANPKSAYISRTNHAPLREPPTLNPLTHFSKPTLSLKNIVP